MSEAFDRLDSALQYQIAYGLGFRDLRPVQELSIDAILDGHNPRNVLARASEPLLYAQMPYDHAGTTPKSVYTDGIKAEGNDTFVVFAGGADSVVEAVRIRVSSH